MSESVCHRCAGPNVSWSAPSPLWNAVMRGGSIDGPWEFDELICPTCFAVLAEERGVASGWRIDARDVAVELETITPSGRVWSPERMLWVKPPDSTALLSQTTTPEVSMKKYPVRLPRWRRYPKRSGDTWLEDELLEAIRLWAARRGQPPRWVDWTPSRLRARGIEPAPGVLEGRWPSARTVTSRLGCSWNDALRQAGVAVRPPHRPRLAS